MPAIIGASLLELPELLRPEASLDALPLAAAALAAFSAGMLAIVLFVRWLRSGHFHRFAYYCWVVGAGYIVFELIAKAS